MLKVFNNKSDSPKIEIESKFVINKNNVENNRLVIPITKDDYLFVKLTITGMKSTQKINQLILNMMCVNAYTNTAVKVIKCNSTSIKNADIKDLAKSFTGDEEVLEKTIIYGQGHSLSMPGDIPVKLDLTNLLKDEPSQNPTIMFAINFPYGTCDDFGVYSPDILAVSSEICTAVMSEISGLSSLYKYDEHELKNCGKASVNLATGKPIYSLNVFSSVGKKIPINFSLYQNPDNNDGVSHLKNKVVPNFYYRIYEENGYYIIENPSGFKNFYQRVIYTNESKSEIFEELGIKHDQHLNEGMSLYLSQYDFSYFYILQAETSEVHLYDKSDIHTYFLVDSTSAKIQSIETALGYKLNYKWNDARLDEITNTDGETMVVEYTAAGYIEKISFPIINKYIDFVESSYAETLEIKTYHYKDNSVGYFEDIEEETINHVKLFFNDCLLNKVVDLDTNNYLLIEYNDEGLVSNIGMYSENGAEIKYKTSYDYTIKFTKISDLDGNNIYYYFDNYGRVKTIMDNRARTVTYNYDEIENGESRRLIGVSKVQNNSRNLIENHSFEDENAFSNGSIAWKTSGCTNTKVEIITGGVLGNKCLKVSSVENDEFYLNQPIKNIKPGSYVFKGFIKHPDASNLTDSNLKVLIRGTYQSTENSTGTFSFEKNAQLNLNNENWYQFETDEVIIDDNYYNVTMVIEVLINQVETEIYLDDFQLTNSEYFTRYNLIENGYMEFVDSNNRPSGWTFENFDDDDIICAATDDDIHAPILGENVMRIAPGNLKKEDFTDNKYKIKKMYKTIPINGLAGDQLIFSVFGKASVSNNMIFRAFIKFNYENKGTIYSQFDFDKYLNNWQMLTRSVVAEDNYSEVIVGIEYLGGVEVLLDCFQLYKDSFGKYYNYDSKGNVSEIINSDGISTRLNYNDDNNISEIYSKDGTYFKYSYDSKGRVSSVEDLNSNIIELTYDDDDRVTEQKITLKNGETISNAISYDDEKNEITYTNEFGDVSIKSLDYLNRVISEINYNGVETRFEYNHKSELEKLYTIINNKENTIINNVENFIAYNNQGNIKTIQTGNGTLYKLEYDSFGRLLSIKCNDNYLERYEYDPLINGYRKGQLLKTTFGENGDYYDFEYNNLGQVVKVKLNNEDLVTYSYDENGNVYELNDIKSGVVSYFTYDLKGNLIKKVTNTNNTIRYSYDNLGSIQKVTYNINSSIRSIDHEYEYELNEYSKEGFFNRLSAMYGDEIVISDQGSKGQFGAKRILNTCSNVEDTSIGMRVFDFNDKYDFINYKMETFNSNRTSGMVNGKVFSKESWDSRFMYNKTFYMFIKPTGSYAKENLFTFGLYEYDEEGTKIINIYSHLCVNANGTLGYYSSIKSLSTSEDNLLELNKWNLVGIKVFKKDNECKASIVLNGKILETFAIDESVENINYLIVSSQNNLNTNTSVTTSSGAVTNTSSNLTMPFKVCLMSFGAYDYQENDFHAIYTEGVKYLYYNSLPKSNATIYYNEKIYDGFDVITLNGSLESAKGLKPYKVSNIDKSYRFEKARIFRYDSDLKKHVFGCYDEIMNLSNNDKTSLAYKLPLKTEGTISLRFKVDGYNNDTNQILQIYSESSNEQLGLFINKNKRICIGLGLGSLESENEGVIEDNNWHHLILRFKHNRLEVYLDSLNNCLYEGGESLNLFNEGIYLGNNYNSNYPLNGCIEMLAFKDTYVSDDEIKNILNDGSTIVIRNEFDFLGRLSKNKIMINEDIYTVNYETNKTRISKQILHNGDTIEYSYDAQGNIISKKCTENGVESCTTYTYDNLNRLEKETHSDGKVEEFKYDLNGNITSREIKNTDGSEVIEEYSYDSELKDKLEEIKIKGTEEVLQKFTYSTTELLNPSTMIINGLIKSLTWQGKRLVKISDSLDDNDNDENAIIYEYNSQGIRTKKITPSETTTFELEGKKIIRMNKVTSTENVILDFVYDASSRLVGVNTIEGNYFYVRDITGNIIGLIDKNGNFVVKYEYDAWGKLLEELPSEDDEDLCIAARFNPFIYKDAYYDSETGLMFMGLSYYSPEFCRFIQPVNTSTLNSCSINEINLYSFTNNNPIDIVCTYHNSGNNLKNTMQNNNSKNMFLGHYFPDLSFLSTGLSFIDNLFSTFAGLVDGYQKISKKNIISGLDEATTSLMILGIILDFGLSAYDSFLVNASQSLPQKWGNFVGDVAYSLVSNGITYLSGYLVGLIPYVGPIIAAPVSIIVGTILDQIWYGENVLWIPGANVSIKGKSLEEWFKDWLTEKFGG